MSSKDCENVCTEIVEEFIKNKLVGEKRRADLVNKLKNGVMKSEDWIILAELGAEDSTNG